VTALSRIGLYLAAWLPMVPIAIVNGTVRQACYGRYMTELAAHQLSTASGLVLLGAYIWLVMRRWPPTGGGQALSIGFLWLTLTLAFEFLFGHYVAGHTWARLFADYNLLAGRVWILIPLGVGLAPWIFCRISSRRVPG
jgi:hypothetical protein